MPFLNRIRLPFYLSKPQFPDERNISILADGSRKTKSAVLSKVYVGETDKLPEWVHERLKIALLHDTINIEGNRYIGGAVLDGSYDIDWLDFLDYPYARSLFKVAVTPYNMANANCISCEEATQLALVDDNFVEQIDQSTEYTVNVFTNDTISCSPFTASVTYYNPQYVASATIDAETGILTINTAALFFQRNTVKLVTYRVTCQSGSYDEADVYANMAGSAVTCLEPTDLETANLEDVSVTINWTAPSIPPAEGYDWKLVENDFPAIVLDSGTTLLTTVNLPAGEGVVLESGVDYTFSVRSICDAGASDYSEWVNLAFTTTATAEDCGRYRVTYFDEFTNQDYKDIQYLGCNDAVKTIRLRSFKPKSICAKQFAPNQPVSIVGADEIQYLLRGC